MHRQALLNLFMLVLVAALALVVLYGPGPDDPAPQAVTVSDQPTDGIRRIELRSANDETPLVVERTADSWRLPDHPDWPLNDNLIEQVLALPSSESLARYPADEVKPDGLELAPARLRLRLDDREYRFGAQEPLDKRRYLQVGDTVHLIRDTLIHQLSDRPLDWVSRRLLPDPVTLTALRLPGIALSRDEGGRWQSAPATELGPDALNAFVDGWRHARALAVEPYQAEQVVDTLELTVSDSPQPLRFEVVENDDGWYLQRADLGLRFRFDLAARDRLLRPPTPDSPTLEAH